MGVHVVDKIFLKAGVYLRINRARFAKLIVLLVNNCKPYNNANKQLYYLVYMHKVIVNYDTQAERTYSC